MKFFLDHDVPRAVREGVERHQYRVQQVTDVLPREAPDDVVFDFAVNSGSIMVTCNRNDFLDLASRLPHHGLIIVIRRRGELAECAKLLQLIRKAGEGGIAGNINFA